MDPSPETEAQSGESVVTTENNQSPPPTPAERTTSTLPDDALIARLNSANQEELLALAAVCKVGKYEDMPKPKLVESISARLRFHGSSWVMSKLRGKHDFPYKRILIDVADKLSDGYTALGWTSYTMKDESKEKEIEDFIWRQCEKMVRQKVKSLSPQKRKELEDLIKAELSSRGVTHQAMQNIGTAGVAWIVGAVVTQVIVLDLLFGVGSRAVLGVFGVGAATGVGLAVAALTLGVMVQGTSYSVTIPATVRLISIRKRLEFEKTMEAESHKPLPLWDVRDELKAYGEAEIVGDASGPESIPRPRHSVLLSTRPELEVDSQELAKGGTMTFDKVFSEIEKAPWFSREDMIMETFASLESEVSCKEAAGLIRLLVFASAKREAIVKAYPHISDKNNVDMDLINAVLDDDYDREQARIDISRLT